MVTLKKFSQDSSGALHLVLIHGFPATSEMWADVAKQLADQNINVYVVDLPGFGSAPVSDAWTMEDASDSIYDALKREGIERVVIAGLSLGGYVTFAFYKHYPDIVQALIFSDTKAEADTEEAKKDREVFAMDALKRGSVVIMERMYAKLTADTSQQGRPDVQAQMKKWIGQASPEATAAAQRAMATRPDSTELLPLITVPTLVIVGEDDKITPAKSMREMAGKIKDVRFVEIKEAGHMSPVEAPAEWSSTALAFLRSL